MNRVMAQARWCLLVMLVAIGTPVKGQQDGLHGEGSPAANQALPPRPHDSPSAPESSAATELPRTPAATEAVREPATSGSGCVTCHGNREIMVGELAPMYVDESDLAKDVHWKKGIVCHECHGGNPNAVDFADAHFAPSGFRAVKTPADLPGFCGHCHSNPEYMGRFHPQAETDQEAAYWTSGHGRRLRDGDTKVANCLSCHGGRHALTAVNDKNSPVYPTRVAQTCGSCHSDSDLMAGREYRGKPMAHNQVELWRQSTHAHLLLEEGDLSAPTCNDCHGNHGALAPEAGSVANVCGMCHVKIGELFANTAMKHRFEQVQLPGCGTCHGNHDIHSPTDEMLGMEDQAVCINCHNDGKFGATFQGGQIAAEMRKGMETLKATIEQTKERLNYAARLGMEVRESRFHLREAEDALKNARVVVHSFSLEAMNEALGVGMNVCQEVSAAADAAVEEHTNRRIWLGLSLLPIFLAVFLLLIYIHALPIPDPPTAIVATPPERQ